MNDVAHADFALLRPAEVVAILERLQRERVPTTIAFDDGHAIVSSLLEVRRETQALVFDVALDAEQNQRLFASRTLTFTALLDHVQVGFETGTPRAIAMGDGPAAVVALPASVVRLQRREAFRAALPLQPPIRCTVLDRDGHATPAQAIDLSATGAGLVVDEPTGDASPGSAHELVLSLPDVGRVDLDATLRTVTTAAGPTPRVRMGFRFESLPRPIAQRIQRYVQHLEVHQMRILKKRDG